MKTDHTTILGQAVEELDERLNGIVGASASNLCVRCGLCVQACHYVLGDSDNPALTPIAKAERIRCVYKSQHDWLSSLIIENEGVAIIGVSSPSIESKSFAIVKEEGDKSRAGFKCPGLAHAGAYPIEIVINLQRDVCWVRLVDVMYRMKMYFEDAGKMAFAKNMGMPGSIEKSIRSAVENACRQ